MKRLFFLIGLVMILAGCAGPQTREIILATTTSTYDSGLLDVLIPVFEAESGYVVKTVAVGTGKALAMGREGNADLLLVHAPAAEEEFMAGGYGSRRDLVMHNDFVLLGPPDDPAGVGESTSPDEAMARIAEGGFAFLSRGDDSGTYKKERALWEQAGITPGGEWYLESGQGMGATLRIASEKQAYTLSDRATYLALRDELDLEIVFAGTPSLLNIYHVILVNPERWPRVNQAGAQALADFLLSPEGQSLIGEFGVDRFGEPLFTPDAGKAEEDLN